MPNSKLILIITSSLFINGCAYYEDLDPIPANTASSTFGIRHDKSLEDYEAIATNSGQFSSTDYPSFLPVIKFCYSLDGRKAEDYVATGTLISPDWILTAGHNFYVADEQDSPASPNGISVYVGNDPNVTNEIYEVEKLEFHPTWIDYNDGFFYGNDLCLVKLKKPINSISPAKVNYDFNEDIGGSVWFAGFGDYSQQDGQNPDLLPRKHAIENILDRKVDGIISSSNGQTFTGGLLAFDFDSPDGLINSLGDGTINEDEKTLGSGSSEAQATEYEGTTVEGDSGGPLFIKTSEGWKLAGILSGGADQPIANHRDSSYGDISLFIRTASSADWILSIIK